MPQHFARTVRSLSADRVRAGKSWMIVGSLILTAWGWWFFGSTIEVFEIAESARLEVTGVPRPVVSVVDGQVISTNIVLGQEIQQGDVLVQIDDQMERAALAVGQQEVAALRENLNAANANLEAEERAASSEKKAAASAYDEIRARIEEAKVRHEYTNQRLRRMRSLFAKNVSSEESLKEAQMQANAHNAAWTGWKLALIRRQEEQQVKENDRRASIQEIQRELTEIQGHLNTQVAVSLEQLERQVELRKVRAPIAGRLGQMSDYPPGSFARVGVPVAVILPRSQPRAVAFYHPNALGRIREGQSARMRLDGFPWTQYGSLPATVTRVARETEHDLLRVELEVHVNSNQALPIEHGIPGSAEVAVEQVSPASLVLRAIGRLLRVSTVNRSLERVSRDALARTRS